MTDLWKKVSLFRYENHHLSSIKKKKKKNSWLSQKEKNRSREKGCFKEKEKGKKKTDCLNMALPKKNRLSGRKDIKDVFKKGKTLNSGSFRIKYLIDGSNSKLFAVSVSSRVFKKAVERNRIRRRLSEIIRKNIFRIRPGFKAVISVKKGFTERDLIEELEKIVR